MPRRLIRHRISVDEPTAIRVPRHSALRLFGCVAGAPHIWLEQGDESTRKRVYRIIQGDDPIPDGLEWVASTISDGISLHLYIGDIE